MIITRKIILGNKFRIFLILFITGMGLIFTASCSKKKIKADYPVDQMYEDEASKQDDEMARQKELARKRALEEERLLEEQRLKEQQEKEQSEYQMGSARDRFENEDVYFEYDSASLLSAAQETLQKKGEWLQNNADVSVIIEGHADSRGTIEYNLALGERRAESAKAFLVDLGIDQSRLITVSYGEERPLDLGQNEAAWTKNRRAHFVPQ